MTANVQLVTPIDEAPCRQCGRYLPDDQVNHPPLSAPDGTTVAYGCLRVADGEVPA